MSRQKGLLNLSANFEPQVAEPLDGRTRVSSKSDLYSSSTWTSVDGNNYLYLGIIVSVYDDTIPDNNGAYQLQNSDYTLESSWTKVGTGSGGSGSSSVTQYTTINLEANKDYEIVLSETKPLGNRVINVLAVEDSEDDTIEILKVFNNANASSFYYNSEAVVFNTEMSITSKVNTSSIGTQQSYTRYSTPTKLFSTITSVSKELV